MNLVSNLQTHCFPDTTLREEEIDLLVSVINRFVEKYPESSRKILKGSFKLFGRHRGDIPKEIISFDFPGGTTIAGLEADSSVLVSHAIGLELEADTLTSKSRYKTHPSKVAETMTINTKYGSFIMAVVLGPKGLSNSFLLQMAVAIKELGFCALSSDKTLAFSVDSLHVSRDDEYEMFRLENEIIGNSFSTPEMKDWLRWHRNGHARIKGAELGFFFEESEHRITDITNDTPSAARLWA